MRFVSLLAILLFLLSFVIRTRCQQITNKIVMTIAVDGQFFGQYEVGLFGNDTPYTVQNFLGLCTGEYGYDAKGTYLSYVGTRFHRIIPKFMIQGGDIARGDGKGSTSIYGTHFFDENFNIKHQPFYLSMANSGPDTNGSQFFITTAPTPWLDGKHVVFGKIMRGKNIVQQIESFGSRAGTPHRDVSIMDCYETYL